MFSRTLGEEQRSSWHFLQILVWGISLVVLSHTAVDPWKPSLSFWSKDPDNTGQIYLMKEEIESNINCSIYDKKPIIVIAEWIN